MHDDNPAGIVTLSGEYLLQHENEILNIIKHVEAKSPGPRTPWPGSWRYNQEKKSSPFPPPTTKLAQKLGRELYKAHKGELHFQWSQTESFSPGELDTLRKTFNVLRSMF